MILKIIIGLNQKLPGHQLITMKIDKLRKEPFVLPLQCEVDQVKSFYK